MAFTEADVQKAKAAVNSGATSEDFFKLGLMYSTELEDRGVDYVEAHKWFNLAAMLGSAPACAYREELGAEMSPSDVTQAQKAARAWLREHKALLQKDSVAA